MIEKFPPVVQDRARAIGEFTELPLAPDLVVSLAEDALAKTNQAEATEEFPEETGETFPSASTQEIRSSEAADREGTAPAETKSK